MKPKYAYEFLKSRILELRIGFHPDTPFADYVDSNGNRVYTEAQAVEYDAELDEIFELWNNEVYEVSIAIWAELGIHPLQPA
jgi:hypothetical protein